MKGKTRSTVGTSNLPENSEPRMTDTSTKDPPSPGLEEKNEDQELKATGEGKMKEVIVHQPIADKNADQNAEKVANGGDAESDLVDDANKNWEEENLYCGLGDLDTAKEVNTGEGSDCAKQAPSALSECESEKERVSGDVLGKGTSGEDAQKVRRNIAYNLGANSNKGLKKTKRVVRKKKLVKKGNQAPQTEVEPLPLDSNEKIKGEPENDLDAAEDKDLLLPPESEAPNTAEEMEIAEDERVSEPVSATPTRLTRKTKKMIKKVLKGAKVTGHIAGENAQPSDGHDVETREKATCERSASAALTGDIMGDSKKAAGATSKKVGKIPAKKVRILKKKKLVNGTLNDAQPQSVGSDKSEENVEAKLEKTPNNLNGASRKMEKQPTETGKGEERSAEKPKRSRKRNRKNKTKQDIKKVASEPNVKAETSGKKSSKKTETMGMIFMCSSKTKKDCLRYKILGLPASKKDLVAKIYKGMRLFLFDFETRLMYGIYKATDRGGYNIEPKAFKSEFPSQVRFTILDDCKPLSEQQFKNAIKDNYYTSTKFNFQLNSEQVKKLCKLFIATSRDTKSKRVNGPTKRGRSPVALDRGRRKRGRSPVALDRGRRLAPRDRTYRRPVHVAADEGYDRHPVVYERDAYVAPAVLPHARLPSPLPQHDIPARGSSYAYGRTSDHYQWDRAIEREQGLLFQNRRHQDELQHRDVGLTFAEERRHDPYVSYRDPLEYHRGVYTAGLQPEYYHLGHSDDYHAPVARSAVEYRAPLGPAAEYRAPVRLASDYPGVHLSYRRY